MMIRLFGRSEEMSPKVTVASQIENLKQTTEVTELRIKQLYDEAARATLEARRYVERGDNVAAKRCLAKKNMYLKQAENLGNTSVTLNKQLMTIESQESTKMVVDCLKQGTTVLGALNREMNPDDVDEIMADLEENIKEADEIQESIAGIGSGDLESGTLEDELAAMVNEVREFPPIPNVPVVAHGVAQSQAIRRGTSSTPQVMEDLESMFSI